STIHTLSLHDALPISNARPQTPVDEVGKGNCGRWVARQNYSKTLRLIGRRPAQLRAARRSNSMNGIIYLIGLIVVIMAILSFLRSEEHTSELQSLRHL